MTTGNVIELNISEKAQGYAKIYASLLKDDFQRKRAYSSLVALYALIDALEKTDNDVQKSMTLFRNPILNEQYEISDVYINNWHIDVRVYVEGDAVLVPKSHYDNGITPDFYAVVKVDKTLKRAELVGFADTQNVEKQPFDYHYCSILIKDLISYDAFLAKVCNPKQVEFTSESHEMFQELYLGLMDDEMKPEIKNKLLKHLFDCPQCRTEFCCFTGFEMVSCNMGSYPDLFEDMTLDIVGAQVVDNEKYAGQELTIYIGTKPEEPKVEEVLSELETVLSSESAVSNSQIAENVQTNENEMTVADILDELFNIEEGYIEPEIPQEKQPEENNVDEDALSKAIEEKNNEEAIALQDDEPLDSYEEIPIDNGALLQEETIQNIENKETFEKDKPEILEPALEALEILEDEIPTLEENFQEIELKEDNSSFVEVESAKQEEVSLLEEPVIEEYVDDTEEIPIETENLKNVGAEMEVFEENLVENLVNETEEFSIESDAPLFSQEEPAELEVFETNEDLEVIEDSETEQNSEMEIADIQSDELSVINPSYSEIEESEFEIHQDEEDEEDVEILLDSEKLIQEVTADAKETIQQVIVDYDEFGEPVYSYITSVSQEAQFITDDAIDEDIMNETFEVYPEVQDDDYGTLNPASSTSRPVEYVQNEGFEEWKDEPSVLQDEEYPAEAEYVEDEDVSEPIESEFEEYTDDDQEVPVSYEDDIEETENINSNVEEEKLPTPLPSISANYQDDEKSDSYVDDVEQSETVEDDENLDADEDNFENDEFEDDEEVEEDNEEDEEEENVKKKSSPLVALIVLLLIVAGGAAGAFFFFKNKNSETNSLIVPETTTPTNGLEIPLGVQTEPEQVTDMFGAPEQADVVDASSVEIVASEDKTPANETVEVKDDAEKLPSLPKAESTEQKTIEVPKTTTKEKIANTASRSKSLANAFTNGGNRATLRSVNWLCAPQLFTDSVFKAYMQDLDNILKLNLRKNILDATETPQNNAVTVKMAIDKVGNLSKVLISESSGSKQIDDIVLQSINETFEGEKSQDLNNSALKQDMYYLKVVIKL